MQLTSQAVIAAGDKQDSCAFDTHASTLLRMCCKPIVTGQSE